MNAMASPHPAPSRFIATCLAALKALDRAIDLGLQIGMRLVGLVVAGCSVVAGVRAFGSGGLHVGALCFVVAILFVQFSWRTVPEIVRTGGAHWFSHWTILAVAQGVLLVKFLEYFIGIALDIFSAVAFNLVKDQPAVQSELLRALPAFVWSSLAWRCFWLVLVILASRYTWKLERHWFSGRVSHPIFGRWLEWKGQA